MHLSLLSLGIRTLKMSQELEELSFDAQVHHIPFHNEIKKPLQSMITLLADNDRLLGTLRILVTNSKGKWITAKAIIDPCSTHTFVSNKLANELKLKLEYTDANVIGINNIGGSTAKKSMLEIKDRQGCRIKTDVYLLEHICDQVPDTPLDIQLPKEWGLRKQDLADKFFRRPSTPDILLGVEIFGEILLEGIRKKPGYPTAFNTSFGWVLIGSLDWDKIK